MSVVRSRPGLAPKVLSFLWLAALTLPTPAQAEPASKAEPAPVAPTHDSTPDREVPAKEQAKRAFALGLELARQNRYLEAKESFLKAYSLVPHPVVAYNAALACVALGERERALELFELALAGGPDELTTADREAILAARASLAPAPPAVPNPPAESAEQRTPVSNAPPRPAQRRTEPPRPPPARSPERGSSKTTTGYLVGAAGLALLAGGAAVYLWNDGRHDAWQKEDAALDTFQADLLAANQIPNQNAELRRRAEANDDLLESIQAVDVVNVAIAVVGLAGVATGTYFVLSNRERSLEVALGRRLELRGTF